MRNEGEREELGKKQSVELNRETNVQRLRDATSTKRRLTSGQCMNEGNLHLDSNILKLAFEEKQSKEAEKVRKEEDRGQREEKK